MVYNQNPYAGYNTLPVLYPMQADANMYQQSFQAPMPRQPESKTNIVWVQGEAGARAHHLDPGQMMALFDSELDYLYLAANTAENIPVKIKKYQMIEVPLDSEKQPEVIMQDIDLSGYVGREEFEEKIKELGYVTKDEFNRVINELKQNRNDNRKGQSNGK